MKRVVFVPLWKPSQHDNLVVASAAQMPRINSALVEQTQTIKSVQFIKNVHIKISYMAILVELSE